MRARRNTLSLCEPVEVGYDSLSARARDLFADEVPGEWRARSAPGPPGGGPAAGLGRGCALDRERHRQLRIHALESLSEMLTARGLYARAIDAAYAAWGRALHESAHAALIAAHVAEGNRVEAVRQFNNYSVLLAGEAGMTPSPRLAQLLGDMGPDEHRQTVTAPPPRRQSPNFDRTPCSRACTG